MGFRSPAAFYYRVRVMGWRPDGSLFYRTSFRCFGDAGPASWLPPSLVRQLDRIREMGPAELQPALDKATPACGRASADRPRGRSVEAPPLDHVVDHAVDQGAGDPSGGHELRETNQRRPPGRREEDKRFGRQFMQPLAGASTAVKFMGLSVQVCTCVAE